MSVTSGGYGDGPTVPSDGDLFAGRGGFSGLPRESAYRPPIVASGYGMAPPPGNAPYQQEVNALATLSVVFAFILAPVGAVMGQVALYQIGKTGQPGRERALIGVTVSFVMIFLLIIALVVWLMSTR
ncbi:DUF4190 domain-containing protein [Mycobacterium sp. DL99]|uniref:DUF4190 domain-containing protein n=1 Tax=Mycobacterium sp. DL99 TaxID=2528957 RepID=UPI001080956C|nr:DUF4190 domain-containing protein [Mycobacterium sp. DL99]